LIWGRDGWPEIGESVGGGELINLRFRENKPDVNERKKKWERKEGPTIRHQGHGNKSRLRFSSPNRI